VAEEKDTGVTAAPADDKAAGAGNVAQGSGPPLGAPAADTPPGQAEKPAPEDPYDWEEEAQEMAPSYPPPKQTPAPETKDTSTPSEASTSGTESAPKKLGEEDEPAAQPSGDYDPAVLSVAAQLGFSPEEIKAHTPKELSAVVRAITQRDQAWRSYVEQNRPQPAEERKPAAASEEEDIDFGTDEDGKPISGDQYDPGIRNALKSLKKKSDERVKALEDKLRQAEVREQASIFDAAVESLPEEFKPLLGDGPGRNLPQDSPELQRRFVVLQTSGIDFSKDPPALVRQKYRDAAARLFGIAPKSKPKPAPEDPRAKDAREKIASGRGALARPSGRKAPEPDGLEKARRTAEEHMRQAGMEVVEDRAGDDDLLEEFIP
jgi:hypothetical protein